MNIKCGAITVVFCPVWPLIEKRKVQINTMLHASIDQRVAEETEEIKGHHTVFFKVRLFKKTKQKILGDPGLGQVIITNTWLGLVTTGAKCVSLANTYLTYAYKKL